MQRRLILALAVALCGCDLDGDGFSTDDCDDGDADVNPDAVEVCNGVDDDCDTFVDDGLVFSSYRPDGDGDLFGDVDAPEIRACAQPPGAVPDGTDCDDANPDAHPGASEVCDGVDNDCDFDIDEDLIVRQYRRDEDEDGYGDRDGEALESCAPIDGLVDTTGDCDDDDPGVHPGVEEVCNDVDDDCNGGIDDGLPFDTWYPDVDGDGFGDEDADPFLACDTPDDAALDDATDCDDDDPDVRPDQVDPCRDCDDTNDGGCEP